MKTRLLSLLLACSLSVHGSDDVTEPQNRLSSPPAALHTVMPQVSRTLAANPATVEILVLLNHHGYVTLAKVVKSTNPLLNEPCLEALRQWRFQPAMRNGEAVTSSFIQPFSFGQDTFDTTPGLTARPKTRRQVSPVVPDSLKHVSGLVTVAVQLDNEGKITGSQVVSSSEEELNPLALDAVRQWVFSPAYINGKAMPSTVYAPFEFIGQPLPPAPTPKPPLVDNSELKPLRQGSPRIPEALAEKSGEVEVEFTVDHRGYVVEAANLTAAQPELGELARTTVLGWKFTPIVKNGVAIPVRVVQPFRFGQGNVALAKIDRLPAVQRSVAPETPEALKDVYGQVQTMLEIDATGKVTHVEIREATHEEFKAAVLAAVSQWTFKPALRAGEAVAAKVSVPFVFGKK